MAEITPATDATGFNFSVLRKGMQVCGYTTGSGGVAWTPAMWAAFPDAVRICQDATASDVTADVLDVELGAATLAEVAAWKKAAQQAYENSVRPGQREPAIYCSASNVTNVANALVAGGVQHCPLWVADWGIGEAGAQVMLRNSSGPYPVIGVQFQNEPQVDLNLFLTSWLKNVSGNKTVMQTPPGQWNNPNAWTWQDCALAGVGMDGRLHIFTFDPLSGMWSKAE